MSKLEDEQYKFTIKVSPEKGKVTELNKALTLTETYDAKGYLHRYVVKDFLLEALDSLEGFAKEDKKKK